VEAMADVRAMGSAGVQVAGVGSADVRGSADVSDPWLELGAGLWPGLWPEL